MPHETRDLVLAGAILSIVINPLVFKLLVRPEPAEEPVAVSGHDVLVGYGRVGSWIGATLAKQGVRRIVIEASGDGLDQARTDGAEVVAGNAANPQILESAQLATARRLFVTAPEAFEAGQIIEQARAINPTLDIVARAHSDAAAEHLRELGATLVVMGEREIAERMLAHARNVPLVSSTPH